MMHPDADYRGGREQAILSSVSKGAAVFSTDPDPELNPWLIKKNCLSLSLFWVALAFFILHIWYFHLEHLQLAFYCVFIACSLESIRLGQVQSCKAPSSESGLPYYTRSVRLKSAPARTHTRTWNCTTVVELHLHY